MSKFPADDELLSSIIDGDASEESIASVEAVPEHSKRLADMRSAVEAVAATPPEATAERRSASIAAAMAAATPASPEVTSLAAQRHKREEKKRSVSGGWIAAAAAVLLFVLAVPVIFGLGGGTAEVATNLDASGERATEVVEDESAGSLAAAEAEDVVEEAEVSEEAADVAEGDEEAMEEEATDEAEEELAQEPAAAADDDTGVAVEAAVAQSIEELDDLIAAGSLAPVLAGDDLLARVAPQARSDEALSEALATDVNPECLVARANADAVAYDLAVFDPFAGEARLVVIEFAEDGSSRVLDAETCAVID